MRQFFLFFSLLFIVQTPVFSQSKQGFTPNFQKDRERMISAAAYADKLMSDMSNEEKLAQLIMPMVWPKEDANSLSEWDKLVAKGFGGVLWQKGHPEAQLRLTNKMRQTAKIPMLVAMDGEWGLSMRLSNTLRWPRNIVLGAANSIALAEQYGEAVALEAKRMGIHVNFAPVADVNNNPRNPVIGTRSFGSNPHKVAALTLAYARGLEENGVLAVAKHFPGHGDTDVDSHKALPIINKSRSELQALELIPFTRFIEGGMGGMMTAHLTIPALDSSRRAASASYQITTELLQNELGFGGLIFTDGLAMQGILDGTGGRSVAVEVFKAGNDILLAPSNPYVSLRELLQALDQGEISQAEVERRCRKVLMWKYLLEVNKSNLLPTSNLLNQIKPKESAKLLKEINQQGMTLLKNEVGVVPLRELGGGRIALLRYGNTRCGTLYSTLKQYTPIDSYTLKSSASTAEQSQVYANLQKYDKVIVVVTSQNAKPSSGLEELARKTPVVLVFMTSPYTALRFDRVIKSASVVSMGYETKVEAQRSMAEALMGGIPFRGKLPVDLAPLFMEGEGIETLKTRLSFATPQKVGMNEDILADIDRIAEEGIAKGAYPGCQVLVAKDGYIVYSKAFGYKDAAKKEPNSTETLYDLASVTKAIATTPLVMMATDAKLLSVQDRLGKHLAYLKGSNKEGVRISDLLFHTGGMPAVIRFYFTLIDSNSYTSPLLTYRSRAGFPVRIARDGWVRKNWKYDPAMVQRDSTSQFPIRFAKGYYLSSHVRDSIQLAIRDANRRSRGYRYSDIDFLLLQDVLEQAYGKPLDQLFCEQIAHPLGASRLLFKPYTSYDTSEIAEGQRDNFLRKQTLRGDVDDEAAAMLGGVSGNAGLFGNAEDIAKMLQMLLNGGYYGGERYIDEATIRVFTTAKHPTSPYALGFDRHRGRKRGAVAMEAPRSTYGHTGFTGTCFWIDPENNIIYIFLSNRVAPIRWNNKLSSMDIRTRIQSVIYRSL